jgi:hypothetical protein
MERRREFDADRVIDRALERYRESQARPLVPELTAGGPVLPRIRAAPLRSVDAVMESLAVGG